MDIFIWDLEEEEDTTPPAPKGLDGRLAVGFGEMDPDGRDADGELWEADDRAA